MDDVRDVFAPVYRRDERDSGPRDLVRVARDADDAQVGPWGEILDCTCGEPGQQATDSFNLEGD